MRALAVGVLGLALAGCSMHEGVYRIDPRWPPNVMRVRVAGVLERDGRYFVDVYPGDPPSAELFGGGLEADETPREALRREWREELGVDIEVGPLLMVVHRSFLLRGVRVSQVELVFRIERVRRVASWSREADHRPAWLDLDSLRALQARPEALFAALPLDGADVYREESLP